MHCRRHTVAAAILWLGLAAAITPGFAQRLAGHMSPPDAAPRATAATPLALAGALAQTIHQDLVPASVGAVDQIEALTTWNSAGKLPYRIGFPRALPNGGVIDLARAGTVAAGATPRPYAGGIVGNAGGGQLAWGVHIRVQESYRLRLHLANVHLPAGTQMLVSGSDGVSHAFGLELLSPAGNLWTPTVPGESVSFEVHVPAGATTANFALREVMELVHGNPATATGTAPAAVNTSCLVDATCITNSQFPGVANFRHGVAALEFVDQGTAYLCSGGLLNNTANNDTPYLLTANHCFADQDAASSLEATFDYYDDTCNGNPPTTPLIVSGSTLLATKSAQAPDNSSDFTLVQLNGAVPGRWYFGWDANASDLTQGTQLNRLSFPAPDGFSLTEQFSRSALQTGSSIPVCSDGAPRPQFIYGSLSQGATFGGSSGSPLLLANGDVVGQLGGGCAFTGHDPSNGCDYANSEFDGAFNVSYPFLQAWLSPAAGQTTPCVANATTLCIDNNAGDHRFKVTASFKTSQGGGLSGNGNSIPLSSLGIDQGGILWFFSATNPELLVKIINACPVSSTFWVFFSATTNVGLTINVTDTNTGHVKTYLNPDLTAAQAVQDTNAFPCP